MSDGDTWISSFEAVKRLREANFQEAETTLTLWAEARHLRARAKWGRFADSFSEQEFPPEPLDQSDAKANGSWPDIPADFWYYVNRGGPGVKAHVEAGVFAARVVFDPHWDDESEHITLFGVTFHEGDLHDLLGGNTPLHEAVAKNFTSKGRRPNIADRDAFSAALAHEFYRMGLKDEVSKKNGKITTSMLYQSIRNAMGDKGVLSRPTVTPLIEKALGYLYPEKNADK